MPITSINWNRAVSCRSTDSHATNLGEPFTRTEAVRAPRFQIDGDSGSGLVCIVSRHNRGQRPMAFLNASRKRFSLA